MADRFDLIVRGGTLLDGTGAPPYTADVGVRHGQLAALGRVEGEADRMIDATGAVVSPGFIDIHTHYDAQIFWDPMLTPSVWHGVTSVVIGNCGFGVAPTRPRDRDLMLRTLESVEGMSLEALHAGLGPAWPFESFPEYLDALESRGRALNVAALVGHTPLRTFVMGEEATEREATPAEVEAMRRLVDEALAAGALGFATSKATTLVGARGRPVPSRAASLAEIEALAGPLREHGRIMEVTIGPGFFLKELADLTRKIECPLSWTALLGGMLGPDGHRSALERCAELQAQGVALIPQVSCRPLVTEFNLKAPFPLESLRVMRPVSAANFCGRKRLYGDPAFREEFRSALHQGRLGAALARAQIAHYPPDSGLEACSLENAAEDRGVDPFDLLLDLALETELEARFRMAVLNTDDDVTAELLTHPASMLGLSDAGAHASQLCDAGAPTTLLGKWVRDKRVLSLEEAVRMLTSQPAEIFGITDRGRLEVGLAADLCVFDPAEVACGELRRVHDFPAGADRLVADAFGVRAVIVNGTVVREDGKDRVNSEASLPGRILRRGEAR